MFMLSAGASLMAGFYYYDVFGTDSALGISLMLWAYSTICLGFSFVCMFKRQPKGE